MSEGLDLRSAEYRRQLGWGVLLGLLSGAGAYIFIRLMDFGIDLIWPDPPSWEPFSGSWSIVAIMTVAGLVVGLIHHFTSAAELDVFEAVDKGRLDPEPVPSSLLASLVSLIGGFSLGPEVPTGMLAAGLGTWLSERREMDEELTRTNVIGGVSGAYSGLFSSPFAVLLIILESAHMQNIAYYGTLLIVGLAGAVGFSLFFWAGGDQFSNLLGLVQPQTYDLRVVDLGWGIIFGILAVPFAVIFLLLARLLKTLVAPLDRQPIIRGVLGGLLLGLLGKALPLTLFLGTDGLSITTGQAAEIGLSLLILFALAKMVALSGALAFGFIGGPIFPLLFIGATLGSAVNLMFPQIPLGLAAGCLMVAIPAAIVPIPLALAVIGILVMGLSPMNSLPVVLASLVAFAVAHGLGLFERSDKKQPQSSDESTPQTN